MRTLAATLVALAAATLGAALAHAADAQMPAAPVPAHGFPDPHLTAVGWQPLMLGLRSNATPEERVVKAGAGDAQPPPRGAEQLGGATTAAAAAAAEEEEEQWLDDFVGGSSRGGEAWGELQLDGDAPSGGAGVRAEAAYSRDGAAAVAACPSADWIIVDVDDAVFFGSRTAGCSSALAYS